jgi:hypothetical protein
MTEHGESPRRRRLAARAARAACGCRAGALAGVLLVAPLAAQVPTDVQLPGTQPLEVAGLETPNKCDNCHGGYDTAVEPAFNWRGGAMSQAGRDPVFWATLAIAEQDLPGVGDLCLRCHSPDGWISGRSTPTDGSGLGASDGEGVTCSLCHQLTAPDGAEWAGVQNAPFLAQDDALPPTGYVGSGMYVLWGGNDKLGPYLDADPPHPALRSRLHRSAAICGTCHDVSNPAVGDLAHNHGAFAPLAAGTFSGVPGTPVDGKAAFNNFPYRFGIVERTYSEHLAGGLSTLALDGYASLPVELRAGAIRTAYERAIAAGGDYQDGTPRTFSCLACHMPPVSGRGCNKNPPLRPDLPLHDQTGGNAWLADAILWLDARGELRLGGGLDAVQRAALAAGRERARAQLAGAAALEVAGDTVRVVNLTGHKLPTGYPEGRRMWLNARWYDASEALMREDGAYGTIEAQIEGAPVPVATLLDLGGAGTRIYESKPGMTSEWAAQLVALGVPASLPLGFDRQSGAVTATLGGLAAEPAGTVRPTFHFALNNAIASDDRIPTWAMRRDVATERNALPVPPSLYGDPAPDGVYRHWDELALAPPAGAERAEIRLLYQPTSWEYVQFLELANTGASAFLAEEGEHLREAWLGTGMAAPFIIAEASWSADGGDPDVIFGGNFESGDVCDWSANAGSADSCGG